MARSKGEKPANPQEKPKDKETTQEKPTEKQPSETTKNGSTTENAEQQDKSKTPPGPSTSNDGAHGNPGTQRKNLSQQVYTQVLQRLGLQSDLSGVPKIAKKANHKQKAKSSKRKASPLQDLHKHQKRSKYHDVSSSEEDSDDYDEECDVWNSSSDGDYDSDVDSSPDSDDEPKSHSASKSNKEKGPPTLMPIVPVVANEASVEVDASQQNQGAYAIFEEKMPAADGDTSAPLPEPLSRLLNAMWDHVLLKPKEFDIDSLYDKYPRPANLDKIILTDCNEEVRSSISKRGRDRDVTIRSLQKPAVKATYILASVLDQLVVLEDATTRLRIIDLLLDVVNILAYLSAKVSKIRRDMIKFQLDFIYQVICERPRPSQQWLFGDDLVHQLEDAVKTSRVTKKINKRKGGGRKFYKKRGFQYHKKQFLGKHLSLIDDWHYNSSDSDNCFENIHIQKFNLENLNEIIDSEIIKLSAPQDLNEIGASSPLDLTCLNSVGNNNSSLSKLHDLHSQNLNVAHACRQEEQEGMETQEKELQQIQLDISLSSQTQVGKFQDFWLQTEFKAGSIADHLPFWYTMTSDSSILQLVKGVELEFDEPPSQKFLPPEIKFSSQEQKFLDNKIDELLASGVVEICDHENDEFISRIFLRPKKEGGSYRLILDLSDLNEVVTYRHFKMDSLDSALNLIKPGSYMASLDIQDSFFSVNVIPQSRKYLKFFHHGTLMQFTCLPQGLGCSPRIFTKLMKIPLSFVRQKYNYLSSPYVDDVFLAGDTKQEAKDNVDVTGDVLQKSGYAINFPKSQTDPGQTLDHVGFFLSSISMTVTLTERKITSIRNLITQIMKSKKLTIRKFAKVLGTLVATLPANRYGLLYTKPLEISKTRALTEQNHDYDRTMSLSTSDRECLDWWFHNLDSMYKPIITPDPQYTIYSDSSLEGWGFHDPQTGIKNGGQWPVCDQLCHINVLELKGALISVQSCCKNMTNKHVRLMSDSSTTVHCINNQGSTKSPECHQVARDIWFWCIERDIWISAAHIPGTLNFLADEASRQFNDDLEWGLKPEIFDHIMRELGPCDIDLFATQYNHKLPVYCAWQPDPHCSYVDAFSLPWKQFKNPYIFAPFSLVGKVMQKINGEELKSAVIVIPAWNTQHWFSLVHRQCLKPPINIKVRKDTLVLHTKKRTHPLVGKLTLQAILVSGQPTKGKDILQE